MNIFDFYKMKQKKEKITVVTCYDYTSACMIANTGVNCVLVGDSVAMTMHGFKDTLAATLAMMQFHTRAVSRGIRDQWIISDMPFLSYRKSLSKNVSAAQALIQAGAQAVKIECAKGNTKLIKHLTESGIPVAGHLGLTPQFIYTLGGYRVQGKSDESAKQLAEDAALLAEAGCFTIFLECIPTFVAKRITESLAIPTIGIGAGPHTDGQVLVFQDLLGLNPNFMPKFAKKFVDGHATFKTAIEAYVHAVKRGDFPHDEHCYNG